MDPTMLVLFTINEPDRPENVIYLEREVLANLFMHAQTLASKGDMDNVD